MPEVSIIMPVYNKEKYLKNSLESVINQTFSDFELLVVNDGSTDHSFDIIQDYAAKDSRIKCFSQNNQGVSAARNFGLEQAQGEWIQFLDGDDLISRDYLTECVPIVKKTNADILFTDFENVNNLNQVLEITTLEQYKNQIIDSNQLRELFILYQFKNGFFGFISNKLIKKELVRKANKKFDETLKLAEDLDFFVGLYSVMEKGYISDCISFRYLHTVNNSSASSDIDYYSQLRVRMRIVEWFEKTPAFSQYKDYLNHMISDYTYAVCFDANERKEDFEACFSKIYSIPNVGNHLMTAGLKGFKRKTVEAVIAKDPKAIKRLFIVRNGLRMLYRRVKHV